MYKSYISNYTDAIIYSDSIIVMTIELNHKYYPALGYMIKGYHYYNEGEDKKAVDEYLKANKYAAKNNNLKQQIEIKQFIGGIKYNFNNYKEALVIFKEQLHFLKRQTNYKKIYKSAYLIALDDLSKTFLRGNEINIDSSLIYIKEGIVESLKSNETEMYNRFLSTSGSAYFYKEEFARALDSLEKVKPRIKDDDSRLAMCLYYIAKIHQSNNIDKSIPIFNQVDSLYQITNNPFIELRDVYKSLSDYYSSNKKEKEQLASLKKLISVDSILDLNYNYSETEIIKKYDIPKLKTEKRQLEKTIANNSKNSKLVFLILSGILLISLIFIIIFYRRQSLFKKRYEQIVSESKIQNNELEKDKSNHIDSLNISPEILDEILVKLNLFEKEKGYLKKGITLNSFSKDLNTNSSYLSKIINHYKEQSFSKYLNSLRINYAINELKKNPTFRKYTINAIASEVGFNTAESFSKSFFKEKGIYPSYFIKQLNKS